MAELEGVLFDSDQFQASKTALIVVDVQNDFCHKDGVFSKYRKVDLEHVEQSVVNLSALIERCRQIKVSVIFVRAIHSPWTDSSSWLTRMRGSGGKMQICRQGSWGSEFYKVAPEEGECIVTKHRYSAFFGTDLDLILKSRGIDHILLTGVVTNVCVETTARDGFNRDYHILFVEDCCGAYDLSEHAATLSNIERYFGTVTTSKSLAEILGKQT